MNKIKQKAKIKEPIRLRVKKISNGCQSLYLDTYHKGKREYEFLRLYLIPEKTAADKAINAATLRAASAIKATRMLDFINGKTDVKIPKCYSTVQDWIEHIIKVKTLQRSPSMVKLMRRLLRHLDIYQPRALMQEADRNYCIGFISYLKFAKALNSPKLLKEATRFELLNALSIALNEAVRAGLLASNPMRMLNAAERIKKPESTREVLTIEEVKSMISVAADNIAAGDDIAAFLFCCFCGLRYSDVAGLKWQNIMETDKGLVIITTMKKTHRLVEIPVSRIAASILPTKRNPDEHIFSFPGYGTTLRNLGNFAKTVGIKKKLHFTSRATHLQQ